MITLDEFDEKIIKGFFASIAILLLVLGLFSTIIQPAYAAPPPDIPILEENLDWINTSVFLLAELFLPGLFIFFSLGIVLRRVPLLQSKQGEEDGETLRKWLQVSLSFLVVGSHLLAIYEVFPLTFDVVHQIQTIAPGLVWFVATFFLISLIIGVFEGDQTPEGRYFQRILNGIFLIVGVFLIFWAILSPVQSAIVDFFVSSGYFPDPDDLSNLRWAQLVLGGVAIFFVAIFLKWIGFFKTFKKRVTKPVDKWNKGMRME